LISRPTSRKKTAISPSLIQSSSGVGQDRRQHGGAEPPETFAELGRLAPEWDLGTLHSSMKWSAGLGIRAWASGFVVRVDTGFADEGAQVQMIISQPFQIF
jgi:hypothetical protein